MNKKIIIIAILSIITGLVILNLVKTKDIEIEKTQKQVNNTNMLTMMLETEAGTGNYEETTASEWPQDGYIFNESLSRCENGGMLSWDDDAKKVIMKSNTSDKCYVYFDKYNPTFAEYIINNLYTTDGENGLYYHDGVGSYTNADQEAGDNSYRYSGADPNNYVCFGSDAATCPNDNLYRIIGLFDDDKDGNYNIKLIKYDYTTNEMLGTDGSYIGFYDGNRYYRGNMHLTDIAVYSWSGNKSNEGFNDWTTSELNKINLNTNYINYLNNINIKWANMIATTTWYLGGMDDSDYPVKQFYVGERNNSGDGSNPIKYSDEIGLMYPSDYGYATSPDNWSKDLSEYQSSNWLFMGLNEWTITHSLYYDNNSGVFYLRHMNDLGYYVVSLNYAIRPVFYLKLEVSISSGTGTSSNPYRLKLT